MTKKQRQHQAASNSFQLRIIAGMWRGRKITFQEAEGLRPTSDRIRETLFNWLGNDIIDARCLDLFAGSGALAFEALSRGATHVDLVELNSNSARLLTKHLNVLGSTNAIVHNLSAQNWLDQYSSASPPYDLVFLDPPFHKSLLEQCFEQLNQKNLLAHNALLYVETGRNELLPDLPSGWDIYREKTAGQVCYRLVST